MYYVYKLTDPRDGLPFYVGKGQGNRINHHEVEAKSLQKRSKKCTRIRDIQASGLQVKKQIIKHFDDEDEAYDFEREIIDRLGRDNLTNCLPGGRLGPEMMAHLSGIYQDKQCIVTYLKFAEKSKLFTIGLRFHFTGLWYDIPQALVDKVRREAREVWHRRGAEWAIRLIKEPKIIEQITRYRPFVRQPWSVAS